MQPVNFHKANCSKVNLMKKQQILITIVFLLARLILPEFIELLGFLPPDDQWAALSDLLHSVVQAQRALRWMRKLASLVESSEACNRNQKKQEK